MSLPRHSAAFSIFVLAASASLYSGCSSARLTHFDHRDFKPLYEVGVLDSAWMAVDSCATGVHAIVALELESNPVATKNNRRMSFSASEALPLTLSHGNAAPITATFARLEGPVCMPVSERYGARQIPILADPTTACFYVYHAEFRLASVPKTDQEMILRYGGQEINLAEQK